MIRHRVLPVFQSLKLRPTRYFGRVLKEHFKHRHQGHKGQGPEERIKDVGDYIEPSITHVGFGKVNNTSEVFH